MGKMSAIHNKFMYESPYECKHNKLPPPKIRKCIKINFTIFKLRYTLFKQQQTNKKSNKNLKKKS